MVSYRQAQTQTISAALAEAAGVGGLAPSIHNTQPWRWRVDGETLELYAEPTRQRPASDPGRRMVVLSCGAALHHARTALAAHGWRVEVDRLPALDRPELLARLSLSGRSAVTREAMRLLNTIRIRHTDRPADTPVTSGAIDAIRVAVEVEHAWLHTLRPSDVLDLATAADPAQTLEEFEPLQDRPRRRRRLRNPLRYRRHTGRVAARRRGPQRRLAHRARTRHIGASAEFCGRG